MSTLVRPLAGTDLAFACDLSRRAGWNQTLRDWERFLSLGEEGCFLAEEDGQSAGTATTTCYGTELAWIGMVLVHPDFRRRGIGTGLLRHAISFLREDRGIACVRLDATPEGRPLYESLGFEAEWDLSRWQREPLGDSKESNRAAVSGLSPEALALDHAVFGADRSTLLGSLVEGSFFGIQHADGSFGMIREGVRATYLGPVTAASTAGGLEIAAALIRQCPMNYPVFWDFPDQNIPARELADSLGFRPARRLTRMRLGEGRSSSDPLRLFGLAEPALG